MPKILLVEDATDFQLLVKETLSKSANVRIASTIAEARAALAKEKFELLILDLSLPDGDGMEFFSQMQGERLTEDTAVIFLTAKSETAMQVTAFSLGADDYVVKPFKPLEFRARVEAKLKKQAQLRQHETVLIRGDLRIELGKQRAFIVAGQDQEEKQALELTGREFKLLYHLAKNEGTVFSRDQLISAVWGSDVHVLDRTVDTHVYTLRKKLGPYSRYIESEVGMGYRLNSAKAPSGKRVA
jgi:two-component system alkaline phosphatase synthesis response regulator PhoP